jgi:hypothetical protein
MTPSKINSLLKVAGGSGDSELIDEIVLLFLFTTGLTYPEMMSLKIKDVLTTEGKWIDEVLLERANGIWGNVEGIFFLTNKVLLQTLDDYLHIRWNNRHQCTFDISSYKGLNPDSTLLLTNKGENFLPVIDGNHVKWKTLQVKIATIFISKGLKSKHKVTANKSMDEALIKCGLSIEQSQTIRKGHLDKINKLFNSDDLVNIKSKIKYLYKDLKTAKQQSSSSSMTVWHYCSIEALISIIDNQKIWFSDLLKMNDPKELIGNLELSEKLFSQIIDTTKSSYPISYEGIPENSLKVYSCSFSKKEDDLNQWRIYADDGTGVCLGFKKNMLENQLQKLQGEISDKKLANQIMESSGIEDIIYDKTKKKKNFESKVTALWTDYKNNLQDLELNKRAAKLLTSYIWKASSIHKSNVYKDEQEVRAFITVDALSSPAKKTIRFRNGSYGITTFLNFPIEDCLNEVIIGPKCNSSVDDITLITELKGIKIKKVTKSEIEYR